MWAAITYDIFISRHYASTRTKRFFFFSSPLRKAHFHEGYYACSPAMTSSSLIALAVTVTSCSNQLTDSFIYNERQTQAPTCLSPAGEGLNGRRTEASANLYIFLHLNSHIYLPLKHLTELSFVIEFQPFRFQFSPLKWVSTVYPCRERCLCVCWSCFTAITYT